MAIVFLFWGKPSENLRFTASLLHFSLSLHCKKKVMKQKAYIVGICGGSASGKTYLLHALLKNFQESECALISQDNYYKPKHLQDTNEDGLINFDHPNSLNMDKLMEDVQQLLEGKTIHVTEYTFNKENVVPQVFTYSPTPIIILEGILIYHKKALADMMDLKVFVDADEHVRLTRRLVRDVQERDYSYEDTLRDYNKFVAPMYAQFVEPTKKICDIIIPNNHHMDVATEVIINHIRTKLSTFAE